MEKNEELLLMPFSLKNLKILIQPIYQVEIFSKGMDSAEKPEEKIREIGEGYIAQW